MEFVKLTRFDQKSSQTSDLRYNIYAFNIWAHSSIIILLKKCMYVKKYLILLINKDITHQSSEHKKNTNNDESFDCSQSFCLWNIGGNRVENVDQNQKYRDEQRHPAMIEII